MQRRFGILGLSLVSLMLAVVTHAAEPKDFDLKQIRAATSKLIAALEDPDPTAWVYMYTEDAGVLEAGSKPLEGRAQLLGLAKSMQPMSSVVFTPSHTEGHGTIAYMYGTATWVNGRPQTQAQSHGYIWSSFGARNRMGSGGWRRKPWYPTHSKRCHLTTRCGRRPVSDMLASQNPEEIGITPY